MYLLIKHRISLKNLLDFILLKSSFPYLTSLYPIVAREAAEHKPFIKGPYSTVFTLSAGESCFSIHIIMLFVVKTFNGC